MKDPAPAVLLPGRMTLKTASRGRSPPRTTRRRSLRASAAADARRIATSSCARRRARDPRARRASASTPPAMAAISRDIAASTDEGDAAEPRCAPSSRACLASRRSRRAAFVSARRSTWTSRRVDVDAPRDAVSRATAVGRAAESSASSRASSPAMVRRAPARARASTTPTEATREGDGARAEAPARDARGERPRGSSRRRRGRHLEWRRRDTETDLFSEESHRAASDFKVKVKRPEDQARARQLDSRRRVVERAAKGTWTRSSDADARADDRWDPSHRAPGSSRGKRAGHASDPPSRDVE